MGYQDSYEGLGIIVEPDHLGSYQDVVIDKFYNFEEKAFLSDSYHLFNEGEFDLVEYTDLNRYLGSRNSDKIIFGGHVGDIKYASVFMQRFDGEKHVDESSLLPLTVEKPSEYRMWLSAFKSLFGVEEGSLVTELSPEEVLEGNGMQDYSVFRF